jgi:glycerol dehydrogenase
MTARVFGALPRYIQGAGAIAQLPPLVAAYGKRPFIVADATTNERQRQEIEQQLRGAADRVIIALCGAHCTAAEIERFSDPARTFEADLLAAFGGAAAIGVAKAMSLALALPLVIIPAAPACHFAVSRLIELERDGERPAEARLLPAHPGLVLVDTTLFASTSPRHFIAGFGDALALSFEVAQCSAAGARNLLDGRPSQLAEAAADAAYRAIREHAEAALALRVRRETGEPLERVVEAMVLMSGIAHEAGGPSIAHGLARGLATLPACRTVLHGELVAFALLAQLAFEERPVALMADLVGFYRMVGLPARLAEIGIVAEPAAAVESAARRGLEGWLVTGDARRLAQAMLNADSLPHK